MARNRSAKLRGARGEGARRDAHAWLVASAGSSASSAQRHVRLHWVIRHTAPPTPPPHPHLYSLWSPSSPLPPAGGCVMPSPLRRCCSICRSGGVQAGRPIHPIAQQSPVEQLASGQHCAAHKLGSRPGCAPGTHAGAAAAHLRGHEAPLCQLLQLVPAPLQVPHKVAVKARLLRAAVGWGGVRWLVHSLAERGKAALSERLGAAVTPAEGGPPHTITGCPALPPALPTFRVRSVERSRERRESGKKKCRRPKLSRSFLQISRAKTLRAPGYTTGSSSTTWGRRGVRRGRG